MKETSKYDIFISYRRDGGEYTAKVLRDRLTELGYRVFFDVESLPSGDFNTRLYSVIDECNDFLLILSPHSLDRCVNPDDWVRQEISRALEKGKNIIPIFLRGFTFPEVLPDPIEPLRFKHGVNANTEFFEAFMEKLLSFLYTKTPLRRRKWIKKAVVGLLVLCAVVFGAVALSRFMGWPQPDPAEPYPSTHVEENLTDDLIYYVETCLTQYDIMAGAVDDSLHAFRRYINTGAADSTSMQTQLEATLNTLLNADLASLAPPEDLLTKLADSPFTVSDVRGMESEMLQFQRQWQNYLLSLQGVADGTIPLLNDDKLKVLECCQTILEEGAKYNACSVNKLLLPVTNKDALHDFLYIQMSRLTHVPLDAANWSDNKDTLLSTGDEAFNKMEAAVKELEPLVGSTNTEENNTADELPAAYRAEFPQSLIYQICTLSGLDDQETANAVRQMWEDPFNVEPFRSDENFSPSRDDSLKDLWAKLRQCAISSDPLGGSVCTLAIRVKAAQEGDPNASVYTLTMLHFFKKMAEGEEIDGEIITSADLTDDGTFQTGDIILSTETHGAEYTVTVLRLDEDDLKPIRLTSNLKNVSMLSIRGLTQYSERVVK